MKKVFENISRFVCGKTYKILCICFSVWAGIMEYAHVCLAAATESAEDIANQVTSPMTMLLNIILTVLAVVGGIIIVKNLSEFSVAFNQQDSTGMFHAGRGIGSGAILMSIKLIIKLFGVEL